VSLKFMLDTETVRRGSTILESSGPVFHGKPARSFAADDEVAPSSLVTARKSEYGREQRADILRPRREIEVGIEVNSG
jgi:hypothetical protein